MLDKKYLLSLNRLHISHFKSLWSDIKEAIAGSERDFTSTKLGKAIFLLSIPMVLEMIMESVFAIVDIFFVSKLGADAVATVGITESVMTIVYAVAIGLSTATTALVARRIGEKHPEKAGVAAFQAILAGLTISVLLAIPGVIFAFDFLKIMGASDEMAVNGASYPAIMFGGNAVIMLLFIINAVFRSSGDAAVSMRVLWMANLINLVLDPILIFGLGPFPEMGIKGAAIATNIGRGAAVIYQFYLLFKGHGRIRLYLSSIRFKARIMFKLLRLSLGGIMQYLIATSSWIALVRIISSFGPEVLAGYTIAIRIIIFSMLPSWGLSNAASTLVGQNLGANHPKRAEKAVWITGIINVVFLGIIGIILISIPEKFVMLFIDTPEVVASGVQALRIISYGFVFYGMGMVVVQGFNGAGDTLTPTKINFFCFWLFEIPLAYFLSIILGLELTGVCLAIIIAESVLTTTGILIFRKGKWKTKTV